jgi:hypothetical protein
MPVIDVYHQYFAAEGVWNGVPRHGASVKLTATSDAGMITYEASVSFFPHNDPEDFAVSYDAFFSRVLMEGKGRRSKKKDAACLEKVIETVNELAGTADSTVCWDQPLTEARYG